MSTPTTGISASVQTFTGAVKAVLSSTQSRDNMRALGRQATALLSDELVFEAAAAYLTRICRQVHNEMVRADGHPSPSSEEVVNVHGRDLLLGDTTAADREFLVANRETLAAGLHRRADDLRRWGAAGPARGAAPVEVRAVLDAEQRAMQAEIMAATFARVTEGIGSGTSTVEREAAAAMARLDAALLREQDRQQRYERLARVLHRSQLPVPPFSRARRALRVVIRVFGLTVAEEDR